VSTKTATPRVPTNGAVLTWARERLGLTVPEAAKKLSLTAERLAGWETEQTRPTLGQLRNVAGVYHQTTAFFLRREPPTVDDATRPPDFRGQPRPDLTLIREIDYAVARRNTFLSLQDGINDFGISRSDFTDPDAAAAQVRAAMDTPLSEQISWKDPAQALTRWTEKIENLGVLVFHMSRVDPDDCQGFSVYYDRLPVIVLNGADAPAVRIFTLFHELGHLIRHSGAMCQLQSGAGIEQLCNEFAAAFLIPAADFRAAIGDPALAIGHLSALAGRYSVSQSAIVVRLKTLGYIDSQTLNQRLGIVAALARQAREEQKTKVKKGFVPHHVLQIRNLGPRFVYAVLDAMHEDRISPVDASYFLGSKLGTIGKMESELAKRGGSGDGK